MYSRFTTPTPSFHHPAYAPDHANRATVSAATSQNRANVPWDAMLGDVVAFLQHRTGALSRFPHNIEPILSGEWLRDPFRGMKGIPMDGQWTKRSALGTALRPRYSLPVVTLFIALYFAVLHPWMMTWGATPAEQRIALPGDELVPSPATQSTRAITIDAPAPVVWQWLIQVGQDRGGFYSYDWLENTFGADIHTTNAINPAWQQRATGERVPLMPSGFLGSPPDYGPHAIVDPGRALILTEWGAFVLMPVDGQTTRLIVRDRAPSTNFFNRLVFDPLVFTMEAREMRGIKARAEGNADPPAILDIPARLGWAAAGIAVAGLFLRQRSYRRLWLLVPLAVTIPALALGHDPDAALAAFLAVGITIVGALLFGHRWWGPFPLLASAVMLTLLLAPDAYLAFGWAFALFVFGGVVFLLTDRRGVTIAMRRPLGHTV
jgi:hypothetical protein